MEALYGSICSRESEGMLTVLIYILMLEKHFERQSNRKVLVTEIRKQNKTDRKVTKRL